VRKMHCKYKDNEREAEDKKLTTILLAVAMTLPLVVCGGGNAGNTNGGNTNSGSTDKHTHVEEVMPAVELTCTKTGLTEGKRCSECGEVLVAQETVPRLAATTERRYDVVRRGRRRTRSVRWSVRLRPNLLVGRWYLLTTTTEPTEVVIGLVKFNG